MEQISLLPFVQSDEDREELKSQFEMFSEYARQKRNWENAFQKWSDEHGMNQDNTEDWGCCGYGSMCEWCEDNSYGRPCVRALNAMLRERHLKISYSDRDFKKIWRGVE